MVTILTIWRRLIFTACIVTFLVAASRIRASEIIYEVIPLKYVKAEDVAALLEQSTPAVARDIIADIRSNSLLVFGSKEQIETVKRKASTADVRKALTVDVLLHQILIEAAVLELELPHSQKAGVQTAKDQSLATTGRFLGSGICWFTNLVCISLTNDAGDEQRGFSYVARLDNGFNSTVAALVNEHRVKVIQKPRIQTSSGVPASLFIGETVPYVHGTCYANSGGPHSCPPHSKMGIQLEITPVIESDGTIIVNIQTTTDKTVGQTMIAGMGNVPDIVTSHSQAVVSVRDGGMIMIGGAIHARKQRFPPIPDRGALALRSPSPRYRELVILVQPVVLSDGGDGDNRK